MMNKFAELVIRHRLWVIAATLLATIFLGLSAPPLKVTVDPTSLVPKSAPAIQAIDKIDERFGSKYMVVIGLTPKEGDIFQPAVLEKVDRITQKLLVTPHVVKSSVLSLSARLAKNIHGNAEGFDAKPLMANVPESAAEMQALKQAILSNPIYMNTVVSKDFKTAAVMVELQETLTGVEEALAPIKKIVDEEKALGDHIDVALGGNPVYIAKTESFGRRINFLFPLAIVMIGLLHFEAFRTKQGLILPLVTALIAVVWGMGSMGLLKQSLDIFNSPTPILILAISAGHAVQLLKRFYEEYEVLRATGKDPHEANRIATVRSVTKVGPVMIVAGGVAALGFFSLLTFEIPTIRSFGVFTGVGILSAVLLEMTFIPAVRSMLKPPSDQDRIKEAADRIWDRIPRWLSELSVSTPKRRALYVFSMAVIGVFLYGMTHVVVDNASKNYFSSNLDIQQDDALLNQKMAGTNTLYLMVEGADEDSIKSPKVLQALADTQAYLESKPEVGKTISIVDFLKRMNKAMHGDDPAYDKLPESRELVSQYLFLYSISGESSDFDPYVDKGYRSAKLAILLKTGSNAYIKTLIDDLKTRTAASFGPDVKVSFGGDAAMTIALTDAMVRGKLMNIIQICVAVFLVSAVLFRSIIGGAIVLLPIAVSIIAVFGAMGLLGIPLNIPNSLISAMAVGIGADYAIYMLYRMREQVAKGHDPILATRVTLATAGKACLFVATAVAGGYGVLSLSIGYNVHQWLSLFIIIAMVVSAFASLTLVPAVLLSIRPAFVFNSSERRFGAFQVAASVLISVGILIMATRYAHAGETEDGIMQKSIEVVKIADSSSSATFQLLDRRGDARKRQTIGYTDLKPGSTEAMRYVKFLSPADIAGTSTLMIENSGGADDDVWVYLPALKKVRRLGASGKGDSFVGTDFSYGDILGHKIDDWHNRLLREENVGGEPCFLVESTPKSEAVAKLSGYGKRLSWIRKDNFVTVRVDTWDQGQQPLKRMTFSNLKSVSNGKKWQAMHMEALNLQTEHRTLIDFTELKTDQAVPEKYFKPANLEQ